MLKLEETRFDNKENLKLISALNWKTKNAGKRSKVYLFSKIFLWHFLDYLRRMTTECIVTAQAYYNEIFSRFHNIFCLSI